MLKKNLGSYLGDDIPVVNMGDSGVPPAPEPTDAIPPAEPAAPVIDPAVPPVEPVVPTGEPSVVPPTPPVFGDNDAFSYLTEKLGRTITSLEDLTPALAPELDPQLKAIADWRERTGRPLQDWVKYSQDFKTLSDLDVVKENLRMEYPDLTDAEIDLELSLKYIASDDDLDSERAVKSLNLKKDAITGRNKLESLRLELDKAAPAHYPQDIQESIQLGNQYKELVAQSNQSVQAYNAGLKTAAAGLEKVTLSLGETPVDFVLTPEERASLPEFVNTMPHWKNSDGSDNHVAILRDAAIIRNFDQLIKTAYEQGVSAGTESVASTASNFNFNSNPAPHAPTGKGFQVEGFDKLVHGNRVSIGRKR